MQTRAQKYSQMAYEHISQLDLNETQKKLYGSICHEFPIMVWRSGLAQAVAFLLIKAESSKPKPAYAKFLQHLSSITGQDNESCRDFQRRIQQMELGEYLRTTRTILNAAIWYKRFAESLLKVKAGMNARDLENSEEDESHA